MLPADLGCHTSGWSQRIGTFIAIIGPSGVGKDSLIAGARQVFRRNPAMSFARRVITREPDGSEDHVTVSFDAFREMERNGDFALSWQANGLGYGLPAAIDDQLAGGDNVIANVSRAVIPTVRSRFRRSLVIHITADPDLIMERLKARGRETGAEQRARIARSLLLDRDVEADIRIENNSSIERAVRQLVSVLNVYAISAELSL